jgi:hypothetical protein
MHIAPSLALTNMHKALDPCTFPNIVSSNEEMDKYSTQWPSMDPAPLLTYCAKLMKIGPIHTQIPNMDPLTTPGTLPSHWAQQFLARFEFHLPPRPPTTWLQSHLHKLKAIQQ